MTPEKRNKIKAMLDDPAATDNEKEICRKILKENPENIGKPISGYDLRDRMSGVRTKRSAESQAFWQSWKVKPDPPIHPSWKDEKSKAMEDLADLMSKGMDDLNTILHDSSKINIPDETEFTPKNMTWQTTTFQTCRKCENLFSKTHEGRGNINRPIYCDICLKFKLKEGA